MEKDHNKIMICKQILRAREHSTNDLLERERLHMSEQKLTFNITYYPAFQNFKVIKKELYILVTPNKKHKKVSPILPILGFRNSKRVKDFLVSTELPKLNESG